MIIGSVITVGFDAGTGLLQDSVQRIYCRCDGRTVSQTVYAKLYSYLGNRYSDGSEPAGFFRIPDLQGAFLKGADPNGTVDGDAPTRTIDGPGNPSSDAGTLQNRALVNHGHNLNDANSNNGMTGKLLVGPVPPLTCPALHANPTDPRMPTYTLLSSTTGQIMGNAASGYVDGGPTSTIAPVNMTCDYLIRLLQLIY